MAQAKSKRPIRTKSFVAFWRRAHWPGDSVRNSVGDDLGKLDEIMIDIPSGKIAYAVVSFGGVLRMGNKLFAIPWSALTVDEDEKCLILDVDKKTLESAPGFDKDNWPDMADNTWGAEVYRHYGATPYWEERGDAERCGAAEEGSHARSEDCERAQKAKSPSTQAGEYVREEIEHVREGKHGARSAKQAIAIGLSKARRAGVKLPARPGKKAPKATARKPNPTRSRATLKALKHEGTAAASHEALSRQAHGSARRAAARTCGRLPQKRSAQRAPRGWHDAAVKAAQTRAGGAS